MALSWFRLYSEMRTDPKMLRLTPGERWAWVGLLCIASEANERGMIQICEGVPYEDEELALALAVPVEVVRGVLEKGQRLGMLQVSDQGIHILHFTERQYEYASNSPQARRERRHAMAQRKATASAKASTVEPLATEGEVAGEDLASDGRGLDEDWPSDGRAMDDVEQTRPEQTRTDEPRLSAGRGAEAPPAAGVVEESEAVAEITQLWESCTGRAVSSRDRAVIEELMENNGPREVLFAYREAARRGRMTLPYVRGVLKNARTRAAPGQEGKPQRNPMDDLPDVINVHNWATGSVKQVRIRGRNGDNGHASAEQQAN